MIEPIAPGWYCAFDELHELHRLRLRVLKERLGWKVCTTGGFEIDSFEAVKPHYLVLRGFAGPVGGGVRPLSSTRPTMLQTSFRRCWKEERHPVTDLPTELFLRRAGWPLARIGPPQTIGTTRAFAGFLDVSEESLAAVRHNGSPVLWHR
ncbi:conjugal transfer protein TraI [Mesorhizobium loti]|nr:conjugal transfer protein TraI [Mesorhizobium loti]PBC07390.1 conjugal transfer protein TraI [Mesorhizobium sp. WSM3859]